MRRPYLLFGAAAMGLTACVPPPRLVTGTPSTWHQAGGHLLAAATRVDITPPPGYGMMGWGPEGVAAHGHRQRLQARVLYLEDGRGERIAFIQADLGEVSALLHREISRAVYDSTRLGPDRIVLGATHTHSGPSSYFGNPAYDELGSQVPGHDTALVRFLVRRISQAVLKAYGARRRATLAWGIDSIWSVTRLRSFSAYRRNLPGVREALNSRFSPPGYLAPIASGVDPTWWMMRVDALDKRSQVYQPIAALSVFAIHGTAVPPGNTLYDSDVHGAASTELERLLSPEDAPEAPGFVHLLFNSAEGFTIPNYDLRSRCAPPSPQRVRSHPGPNAPFATVEWRFDPDVRVRNAQCVDVGVSETARLGHALAQRAAQLHKLLSDSLSDTLTVSRAFTQIDIDPRTGAGELCPPEGGVAQTLGGVDGLAREIHWPFLPYRDDPVDHDLTSARRTPRECHAQRRRFLGPLQFVAAGRRPLPLEIQLSVIRVGNQWLATYPGEPTTHSGWRIRRAVADAIGQTRGSADNIAVIGLANGYDSYLTTPEEYAVQTYEGGSTLFGPRTLPVVEGVVAAMARAMYDASGSVEPARITDIRVWLRTIRNIGGIQNDACQDYQPARSTPTARFDGTDVVFEWNDVHPGIKYACEPGPWFVIGEARPMGLTTLTWDGKIDVEVRVTRSRERDVWTYSATWHPSALPATLPSFRWRP